MQLPEHVRSSNSPVRAFCPLWPRPEVFPTPEPTPLPTLLACTTQQHVKCARDGNHQCNGMARSLVEVQFIPIKTYPLFRCLHG